MAIRSDEITSIIKSAIDQFDATTETRSVGTVVEVGDGIAQIYGLADALASEMLEFPGGVMGLALNLDEETVGAVILGDASAIKEGDTVKTTGRVVEVPVGAALLGRVVDPLGRPLDDKGPIQATKTRPVERIAPGVIVRQSVDTPVQTGIKAIDALIPIGRGQRELIIGDRQTGKTAIALDTIINQKGKNLVCIYVAIGQKLSTVANTVAILEQHGAMEHTVVVVAGAEDPAPLQYLAPYAGVAMGEEVMENGVEVAGQGLVCIYVAIGQKLSTVAQTVATLEKYGAMDHTIVVVAGAEDPAPLQYLAPYSGVAMGEEVMEMTFVGMYADTSPACVSMIGSAVREPPGLRMLTPSTTS